jgi:hypothetical protein
MICLRWRPALSGEVNGLGCPAMQKKCLDMLTFYIKNAQGSSRALSLARNRTRVS